MKTLRPILALTLSIFLCATARAELKWEQTTLELHPAVGDKQAIGHFKYQNVGKTPIHFKSVKSSCGCTAAQSQKEQVPPGDKGEITATFNIGDRTGTQVKTVTVETDDAPQPVTLLTLKAVLPEMLTINPAFIFWKAGEETTPKIINVKAGKDFPAKGVKVVSSSPEFSTEVEPVKGGGEWKIKVQPKDTSHATSGTLTITPEVTSGQPRLFYANVSITGAPPAQPPPGAATTPAPSAKP